MEAAQEIFYLLWNIEGIFTAQHDSLQNGEIFFFSKVILLDFIYNLNSVIY